MANFPCSKVMTCPPCPEGDPTGFPNLSAEMPDVDRFFAIVHFTQHPPIGDSWQQAGCTQICYSSISQEDANLCALRLAQQCTWGGVNGGNGWRRPPTITDPSGELVIIYSNTAQTCQTPCPTGNASEFTIPAGTVFGLSQEQADDLAFQLSCQKATSNLVCLEDIAGDQVCIDTHLQIGLQAHATVFTAGSSWTLENGSLPPGVNLVPDTADPLQANIIGTPSQTGVFPFTVRITLDNSATTTHDYTLTVSGITNVALPAGRFGVRYTVTLQTAQMVAPIAFTAIGSLPSGLTLDPVTGVISGLPQVEATSTFTVQAVDSLDFACYKEFTIAISSGTFSSLAASWAPNPSVGTVSGSCSGTTGDLNGTVGVGAIPDHSNWSWSAITGPMGSGGTTLFEAFMSATIGPNMAPTFATYNLKIFGGGHAPGGDIIFTATLNASGSITWPVAPTGISWNAGDQFQVNFAIQVTTPDNLTATSINAHLEFESSS